jgi:hypothetical protein
MNVGAGLVPARFDHGRRAGTSPAPTFSMAAAERFETKKETGQVPPLNELTKVWRIKVVAAGPVWLPWLDHARAALPRWL